MPEMHFKMIEADEKTRIAMKPRHIVDETRDELKAIYKEWLELQHESRKNQLMVEDAHISQMHGNEALKMSLLVEQTRVSD